jgi:hypothetical protein
MVGTSDSQGEGPGFNTGDQLGLFTSFLPLLHIDVPFLATTRNKKKYLTPN